MCSEQEEKVVCVTGASGYIASWMVKLLLQRGYAVKASVRDLNDPLQIEHLISLDGAKERLHLYEADLLNEGSFDAVVDGCVCVFHTASPSFFSTQDPKAELIDPALKGTLNVLQACKKYPTVKRVVLTSSTAAIWCSAKAEASGPEVILDETWFSDPAFCAESKNWYMLSKTLAEEAAWEFAKENGIDLISINPSYVIGPMLQPTLNLSMELILKLIDGSSKTFPNFVYRCVDVRDVALAHILALEVPSATGRYCVVGQVLHYAELLDIVRKLSPSLPISEKCEEDKLAQGYGMSNEKTKGLGIEFTPLEVTLKDSIESFKAKGFLNA